MTRAAINQGLQFLDLVPVVLDLEVLVADIAASVVGPSILKLFLLLLDLLLQ